MKPETAGRLSETPQPGVVWMQWSPQFGSGFEPIDAVHDQVLLSVLKDREVLINQLGRE
jgi:hypothetical protein